MDIKHRTKQLVATVVLAGAVTAGTAGVAVAADGGSATAADPSAQVRHPRRLVRAAGTVVANAIGIERAELREALKSGQSIAEVAQANGVDRQVVLDAVLGAVNDRVDRAVANGRMSEERGATIKDEAAERVPNLLDRHFGQGANA